MSLDVYPGLIVNGRTVCRVDREAETFQLEGIRRTYVFGDIARRLDGALVLRHVPSTARAARARAGLPPTRRRAPRAKGAAE
jgi:hypothetical protein